LAVACVEMVNNSEIKNLSEVNKTIGERTDQDKQIVDLFPEPFTLDSLENRKISLAGYPE
jgi:hypothetical protein